MYACFYRFCIYVILVCCCFTDSQDEQAILHLPNLFRAKTTLKVSLASFFPAPNEIRGEFLKFCRKKHHTVVHPMPLV